MTKKSQPIKIKLAAVIQILALALLAACSAAGASANVCHATGDSANPYEEITIDSPELLNEHRGHSNDIFPVPEGGCPESPVEIVDGNVTICHATSSETNPYEEITVSVNGLNGHGTHESDIIPVPEGGCPAGPPVIHEDALTVCHATGETATPYEAITVESVELLHEHLGHPNDFTPVPIQGCPSSLVEISQGDFTICHVTGDMAAPYEEVTVSADGLDGHGLHEGDVIPAPEAGCPASPGITSNDKVTICHATGSEKKPYNEITVSTNGLNGHGHHPRDIIPAPGGGCPTTRP